MTQPMKHIALFTRYPVEGKCKTRLAAAIGNKRSTLLHRLLTEMAVEEVRHYAVSEEERGVRVKLWVFYCGGTEEEMRVWLGEDGGKTEFVHQMGDDLGERLRHCCDVILSLRNTDSLVIIGSDIPQISSTTFQNAFFLLDKHNHSLSSGSFSLSSSSSSEGSFGEGVSEESPVVFGPAVDGGYYLVGVSRRNQADVIFRNIRWSSRHTLSDTLDQIRSSSFPMDVRLLPQLRDIDTVDDLHALLKDTSNSRVTAALRPIISVIVPVLNEEANISSALDRLLRLEHSDDLEVVIVDGGSRDGTIRAIQTWISEKGGGSHTGFYRLQILEGVRQGRGYQMNDGAAASTGRLLLFLHADTVLPTDCLSRLLTAFADPTVRAGACEFGLFHESGEPLREWTLMALEWLVNWRCSYMGMPYGDQAYFLSAFMFRRIGGFDSVPFLEDVSLVRKLNYSYSTPMAILPCTAYTSTRRWVRDGFWKNTLRNQMILISFQCGVSPDVLYQWYYGRPPQRPLSQNTSS